MIMIALLPLGMLALAQIRQSQKADEDTQLAAAIGRTVQSGLNEIRALRALQVTARILAADLEADASSCPARLALYRNLEYPISFAAYVRRDGMAICTSDGQPRNYLQRKRFASILKNTESAIFFDPDWSPDGSVQINITYPVLDAAGEVQGIVLFALPEKLLVDNSAKPSLASPLAADAMIGFNVNGELIYASVGLNDAPKYLPMGREIATLAANGATSFFGRSVQGKRQLFSAVPVTHGIFFLGVWPMPMDESFVNRGVIPYLFPALMWLTSVLVTMLGVERLVSRHIRQLSRAMRRFALGDRRAPAAILDDPPSEVAHLADAYHSMTLNILRDEAELENLLRQQETLLREVHHRTGNSLQLIASILRMHRRETEDDGIRSVLDDLHNRVMSLSSVHFGLYRVAGGADVAVDALMGEVIAKVSMISGRVGRRGVIDTSLQPMILPAQQAVPLALLLAEILSCFPPNEDDGLPIEIKLHSGPTNIAHLEIIGPRAAKGRITGAKSDAPSVIGARLIRGFVTQLNGTMQVEAVKDRLNVTISFTIRESSADQTPDLSASKQLRA